MSGMGTVYTAMSRSISAHHIYTSLADEMACLEFIKVYSPSTPPEILKIMRESYLKSSINEEEAILLAEEFKLGSGKSRKRISIIIGDNHLAVTVNAGETMKCKPFIPYTKPIPSIPQLTQEFMSVYSNKQLAQQRASIFYHMLTGLKPMWWIEPWVIADTSMDLDRPDPTAGITCISWKNKDTQIFFSLTYPQRGD